MRREGWLKLGGDKERDRAEPDKKRGGRNLEVKRPKLEEKEVEKV